jgi:hypothetical protein
MVGGSGGGGGTAATAGIFAAPMATSSRTVLNAAMATPPFPADVSFALHEIGTQGDFTDVGARKAATDFVGARAMLPNATHMLVVGGYDGDSRELWDIPEARAFVRRFAGYVALLLPGTPLTGWNLDNASIGVIAMCIGFGKVVFKDPATGASTIEVGR